ncbi:hypothetical protein BGZ99_001402 [Dissophora globulifera]|uniref:Uncharacterized protein n=1 Tax=Dissophora globulifera TaxID=979702 RepID=A0A9P6RQP4_9FUNG|nr:hypothetical protein BGZ99_001402 [Dissophora globulifera]
MDERDIGLAKIVDHLLQKQSLDGMLDESYHVQVSQPSYQYRYLRKSEDEENAVSPVMPSVSETLEWEQVVLHTPTKVARRPSLLEKLKRARDEERGLVSDELED